MHNDLDLSLDLEYYEKEIKRLRKEKERAIDETRLLLTEGQRMLRLLKQAKNEKELDGPLHQQVQSIQRWIDDRMESAGMGIEKPRPQLASYRRFVKELKRRLAILAPKPERVKRGKPTAYPAAYMPDNEKGLPTANGRHGRKPKTHRRGATHTSSPAR